MIINNNQHLGYYHVGETIFTSKVKALIEGTTRNLQVEWKFNNDVFNQVNWTIEPSENILQLYKERAQQLREKYDYLILAYSGGSDSHTILQTFLNNNIRLDEIVVSWAKGLDGSYTPNKDDIDTSNGLSEWDFTIHPVLKWLAANHPNIKITIHDWASNVRLQKIEDDYILDRNHNFAPFAANRWFLTELPDIRARLDKIDKAGLILGCDKPRVCFSDGAYRLYFLDIVASNVGSQISSKLLQDDLHTELFYWSPDSIKILAKQAHLVVKFFETLPGLKKYITWPISKSTNRQFYETAIRAIIYPEWDLDTFQVNKPTDLNLGYDRWLFKLGPDVERKILGMQDDNLIFLKNNIDQKYLHNSASGDLTVGGMITGMWPIKFI